ncbi:Glycerophosphodiester phosphodiesterase [Scheffersomyces coipomensis]|uniref:Glycerophosphodiester phosphodiesterase n=1 Tax=Scheffersomyces coipomensis TaxID=1788519 RepID=UPI00315D82A6
MPYTSPVICGHRGFKAKFPENTLLGFGKCFQNGGTIVETDTWLTKDQILIISHDISTKRVFIDKDGNETNFIIPEQNYEDLKDLKTIEGNQPLITFKQLLTWYVNFIEHESEDIDADEKFKIMLDIKPLNPPKILRFIIKDLLSVKNDLNWWLNKVQFGVWDLNFIKFFNQDSYFQDLFYNQEFNNKYGFNHFDIINISGSWRRSIQYINYNFYLDSLKAKKGGEERSYFKITGISLLYFSTWSTEFLTKFIPLLKLQNLKFYSWTINTTEQFDYVNSIGRVAKLPEYGVISDYPDVMYQHKLSLEQESEVNPLDESKVGSGAFEYYDENGDLSIKLTYRQFFISWLFHTFISITNPNANKKVGLDDDDKFSSIVKEDEIIKIKPNPFSVWVFATLQHFGIC